MKTPKEVTEISPDVYWVGVRDWDRKMFDKLIPLPEGTTYNAYLIRGSEKSALVDTVNPGFEQDLEAKVSTLMDPANLDYIVMNHAEPDHANGIKHMLSLSSKAKVLTTEKGIEMAKSLYHIEEDRFSPVEDEERIDLGDKTLQFIHAPWLHWPETMLTYYQEEKILFPCDFFGAHIASTKLFAKDLDEEIIPRSKSYFGEIMMPFRPRVKSALDKLEEYDIEMIAPSHGVIHEDPEDILTAHRDWAEGKVKKKVLVPYISMWGSTKKIVETLVDTIAAEGVDVMPFDIVSRSLTEIAGELVDSAGIILGSPTVLAGPHPQMLYLASLAQKLNPPARYLGVVESHGWAGGAVRELSKIADKMNGEVLGAVEVHGSPRDEDLEKVVKFGQQFAGKIKQL